MGNGGEVWQGGASMKTSKAKQCEELCGGSGVLLGVSPICSTSVVLCALGRRKILFCFMLFLSGGGQRRCPVYCHRVMDCSCLVIGGRIFPVPPKGSAIRICKKKEKKGRNTALTPL